MHFPHGSGTPILGVEEVMRKPWEMTHEEMEARLAQARRLRSEAAAEAFASAWRALARAIAALRPVRAPGALHPRA
jgi:hypothetical protein